MPTEGDPRVRRMAVGAGLLAAGTVLAVLGWQSRMNAVWGIAGIIGFLNVVAGLAFLVAGLTPGPRPDAVHRVFHAELNPAAAWERRHPEAVLGIVVALAAGGLLFLALKGPAPTPDGSVRTVEAALSRPWIAAILWSLVGGLGAVATVQAAVRRRLVDFPHRAAILGLVVLGAAALLALAYFLLLGLPAPAFTAGAFPRWRAASWGLVILLAVAAWWRSLAKEVRRGRP